MILELVLHSLWSLVLCVDAFSFRKKENVSQFLSKTNISVCPLNQKLPFNLIHPPFHWVIPINIKFCCLSYQPKQEQQSPWPYLAAYSPPPLPSSSQNSFSPNLDFIRIPSAHLPSYCKWFQWVFSHVVISLMCQFSEAIVPHYSAKHKSRCYVGEGKVYNHNHLTLIKGDQAPYSGGADSVTGKVLWSEGKFPWGRRNSSCGLQLLLPLSPPCQDAALTVSADWGRVHHRGCFSPDHQRPPRSQPNGHLTVLTLLTLSCFGSMSYFFFLKTCFPFSLTCYFYSIRGCLRTSTSHQPHPQT